MDLPLLSTAADRRLLDEGRATRAMMWIMAIMLFLTVLAGAAGFATHRAADALQRQVAGRLTVQVVEAGDTARIAATRRILGALHGMPEVARASEVDRARLTALLRPWLGTDGADPDLPVPAMIDVDLAPGASTAAPDRVTRAVAAAAPVARVDRHESWMSPVRGVMTMTTWLAGTIVLMMASATAAVVVLAARAGLETHRDTIEVLHMMGSTDVQVARLFQRRIALDTLLGGTGGTLVALATVALVGARLRTLGSDLLDGFALGAGDWIVLALLPLGFALLATLAARTAVLGVLRRIL